MSTWTKDIIPAASVRTLAGLFRERVRRTPGHVAYRTFERDTQAWRDWSWSDMGAEVARWQDALSREALVAGDRVALFMHNGTGWVTVDQAALGLGLVVVPLYTDDRPESVAYILRDCGARALVVSDQLHWRRLRAALADLPQLARVVVLGPPDDAESDTRVRYSANWLPAEGSGLRTAETDPESLATIVYTSGTTGRPKGVMLSHRAILSNVAAAAASVTLYREDLFLSFLPLSHTLERTGGYYLPMIAGSTVAYARSVAQLGEDLRTVHPTILMAVPRVFERVYGRINDQILKRPAPVRALFALAVRLGWQDFERRYGRAGWSPMLLLLPPLRRMFGARIAAALGGRLRAAVSGGAPLPLRVARAFVGLGVPILQGYGLTETAPVVSVNTLEDNDPASVGPPVPGVRVAIGEQDELLVQTPSATMGYWNQPEATRALLAADGWLHTGDQARIENGRIYITGRIKDVLVLSNGEKVPPADLESAIAFDPLVEQALIAGEGQAFLVAILVLNREHWEKYAQSQMLDPNAPSSLEDERVHKHLLGIVRKQLHDFPVQAKVRRLVLSLEAWTVDNGLLTPTMKTRRQKVLERYAERLHILFNDTMRH